ncbi:spore coat protein T domain protein, partial [Ancylostoma caninum]
ATEDGFCFLLALYKSRGSPSPKPSQFRICPSSLPRTGTDMESFSVLLLTVVLLSVHALPIPHHAENEIIRVKRQYYRPPYYYPSYYPPYYRPPYYPPYYRPPYFRPPYYPPYHRPPWMPGGIGPGRPGWMGPPQPGIMPRTSG